MVSFPEGLVRIYVAELDMVLDGYNNLWFEFWRYEILQNS